MTNQQAQTNIPSDFSVPPPPFFQNISAPPPPFAQTHFPGEQGMVPGLGLAFHPGNGGGFNPVFPGPNNFNPEANPMQQHGNGRGGHFAMNHSHNNRHLFSANGSNIQHRFPAYPIPPTQGHTFRWQGGRGRGNTPRGRGRGGCPPGRGRGAIAQNGCNNNGNGGGKWPQQNGKKKKKERVNKQDLAENNVFFCDICDRGFKTEEKYKEHTDGHQKCSFKDCPFVAAPKLVQLHITMQHRGGLAKRVWSVESKEDIEKWKEERRRNFPTANNIERKKQLEAERKATGAVLETKDFSKMRGGRQRERGRGRRGGMGGGNPRQEHRTPGNLHSALQHPPENGNKNNDDDDDDDSPPEEVKIRKHSCQPAADSSSQAADLSRGVNSYGQSAVVNNSGLSLLTCYGDSSSDEGGEEVDIVKTDTGIPSRNDASQAIVLEDEESVGIQNSSELLGDTISADPLSLILSAAEGEKCGKDFCCSNNVRHSDSSACDCTEKDGKMPDYYKTANSGGVTNSKSVSLSSESTARNSQSFHGKVTGKGKKRKSQNQNDDGDTCGSKHQRRKKVQPLPRQYTLLERLLAPDIRRERNKILQCVHYIVKNKFFGVGSSTSSIA